jgi:hypothetical protein
MSEMNRTNFENKIFQKVIDGEFVPDSDYICGDLDCDECEFNTECRDIIRGGLNRLSDPKNYQRFKEDYPEFFI